MANEMEVFWKIRRIDAAFRRAFHTVAEQQGESFSSESGRGHGKILRALDHNDGMTQKDLAERLGIRPQSLTDALLRLEQQGAIVRTRSERDKREQLVHITEAGRSRARHVAELHQKAAQLVLSELAEEEKQQLSTLLERIIASCEETEGTDRV